MDTVNVEKKNMKEKKETNKMLIPSIIALGFIPLIAHRFYYKNGLTGFPWFSEDQVQSGELFLGWKMIITFIIGVIMVGFLVFRYFKYHESLKIEKIFYPLVIYGIFVIISAVFSQYKRWVFCGTFGMLEPVGAVLAYLVICYYTFHYLENEEQIHKILRYAGMGIAIVVVLGTLQFLGIDLLLGTKVGKIFLTNFKDWDSFDSSLPKHVVAATFCNQNNACIFYGTLVPVLFGCIISCKKKIYKCLLILLEIMTVACMIGARSSAGVIALVVSVCISILVLLCRKKKTTILAIILTVVVVVSLILVCALTPIGAKVSEAFLGTPSTDDVRSIDTTNGCVEMNINHQTLKITYDYSDKDGWSIVCRDGEGEQLETKTIDSDTQKITNIMYLGCKIAPAMIDDSMGIVVEVDDHEWYFLKTKNEKYYYLNPVGKLVSYKSPDFLHIFNDNAISGRGRIWNGSLKTIMDHPYLIGVGANAFVFAYPQEDYIYRVYRDIEMAIDVKAHSLYLQQWIENGALALCGFILFFIMYLIQSIKLYRKTDFHDNLVWIGFGIFTGILTYLIAGLANDSNISTAPSFWTLMGIGLAVNRILEERMKPAEVVETEIIPETKEETDAC